jgi:hypothetical protein
MLNTRLAVLLQTNHLIWHLKFAVFGEESLANICNISEERHFKHCPNMFIFAPVPNDT